MELFNFRAEKRDTPEHWALVTLTTTLSREEFKQLVSESKDGVYEIELKINGHEVKFSELIRKFHADRNRLIREKAQELLERKMNCVSDRIQTLEYIVKDACEKIIKDTDLNPELYEHEDLEEEC